MLGKNNFVALQTDLYQLTMAAGYFNFNRDLIATFEMFIKRMPPNRGYFIACGLEQVVEYLLNLKFKEEEIEFLRKHPSFKNVDQDFFKYLRDFKFNGEVWAVPEGTIIFPDEPIIQITAPIIEAQIIETYLLSVVHIQTLVATKASRVVHAATKDGKKRVVVDFGSRRAHGPQAGILAARASFIGGCDGTSNVYAGMKFNIPTYGTMAHSWIESFDEEKAAFENYFKLFPHLTVLLVDTYDTIKGIEKALKISPKIKAIRLDSGNLLSLSIKAREMLDKAGFSEVKIMASGNLNEYKIEELVKNKAPIDSFGVGTELVTSYDLPAVDLIYKLVQVERNNSIRYIAKFSPNKETLPGKKQVFRFLDENGKYCYDLIELKENSEEKKNAIPLLEKIIERGELVKSLPSLDQIQKNTFNNLESLPNKYKKFENPEKYPVKVSPEIYKIINKLKRRTNGR
ncbi:nicotinate phosphoribosyltransferase [Candidatus Aminicenantes bacterium AC-334-E05]|jgi:nicotinate phosphoribosyltransferase|nr:nicotinate phosphoribosyltransferase [Candidatus Aminicenantes bacterium AC-334-E05]